jgi:hypothetical protein
MSTALKLMTLEQFLPWAEGKEGRWERHDGVPMRMAPKRPMRAGNHGRGYVALTEAIRSNDFRAEVAVEALFPPA